MPVDRVYMRRVVREFKTPPLDVLYRDQVLPRQTRRIPLFGHPCRGRIQKTLLGYELRMGPDARLGAVRKTCPDLTTARYLIIFARLGLPSVLIPYNPMETLEILPELEAAYGEVQAAARRLAERIGRPERYSYYLWKLSLHLARHIRLAEAEAESLSAPPIPKSRASADTP